MQRVVVEGGVSLRLAPVDFPCLIQNPPVFCEDMCGAGEQHFFSIIWECDCWMPLSCCLRDGIVVIANHTVILSSPSARNDEALDVLQFFSNTARPASEVVACAYHLVSCPTCGSDFDFSCDSARVNLNTLRKGLQALSKVAFRLAKSGGRL